MKWNAAGISLPYCRSGWDPLASQKWNSSGDLRRHGTDSAQRQDLNTKMQNKVHTCIVRVHNRLAGGVIRQCWLCLMWCLSVPVWRWTLSLMSRCGFRHPRRRYNQVCIHSNVETSLHTGPNVSWRLIVAFQFISDKLPKLTPGINPISSGEHRELMLAAYIAVGISGPVPFVPLMTLSGHYKYLLTVFWCNYTQSRAKWSAQHWVKSRLTAQSKPFFVLSQRYEYGGLSKLYYTDQYICVPVFEIYLI